MTVSDCMASEITYPIFLFCLIFVFYGVLVWWKNRNGILNAILSVFGLGDVKRDYAIHTTNIVGIVAPISLFLYLTEHCRDLAVL